MGLIAMQHAPVHYAPFSSAVRWSALHCTTLHCTALHWSVDAAMLCTTLHYTGITALHYLEVPYTLHCKLQARYLTGGATPALHLPHYTYIIPYWGRATPGRYTLY